MNVGFFILPIIIEKKKEKINLKKKIIKKSKKQKKQKKNSKKNKSIKTKQNFKKRKKKKYSLIHITLQYIIY